MINLFIDQVLVIHFYQSPRPILSLLLILMNKLQQELQRQPRVLKLSRTCQIALNIIQIYYKKQLNQKIIKFKITDINIQYKYINRSTQHQQINKIFGYNFNLYGIKIISESIQMISDKGIYGLVSGIITTSILQPFENVKMALMIPPKDLKLGHNFITNFGGATKYIYQTDGYKGFYKGFAAANIKAGLGCYIYFTVLRYWEKENQKLYEDFIISSTSRIISTFLTNPFNIIETRYELAGFHQYTSVRGAIVDIYKKQGFMSFFSGGMASCLKQGFFGGLYYMTYEELKTHGINKLAAGISSGIVATAITHPIQIIRARIQTEGLIEKHYVNQHLIVKQIKRFAKEGGWFKGLTPRLFKKPLSNTITFYMFQFIEDMKMKSLKKQQN